MPTPSDILMFAPKELRPTVATLVGDKVDFEMGKKRLLEGGWQQQGGGPISAGGAKVIGTISPKPGSKNWAKATGEPEPKFDINKFKGLNTTSAKDSAQTSFGGDSILSKAPINDPAYKAKNETFLNEYLGIAPKYTQKQLQEFKRNVASANTFTNPDINKWAGELKVNPKKLKEIAIGMYQDGQLVNKNSLGYFIAQMRQKGINFD
jgi:hypothetical protein